MYGSVYLGGLGTRAWRLVFWLWVPSLSLLIASLMIGHWYALPTPALGDSALAAVVRKQAGEGNERWSTLHILYSDCPCSRRIHDALVERGPFQDVAETIVLVGADSELESRARSAGFAVDSVTPEVLLKRYHVESAPLLVIADPSAKVCYVGGYTDRKQGLAVKDAEILERLLAGEPVQTLPTYGCGVSQSLQAALDPFKLKY